MTARRLSAEDAQRLLAARAARTAPDLLRRAVRRVEAGPAPAPHPADLPDAPLAFPGGPRDRAADPVGPVGAIMPSPRDLAAQQLEEARRDLVRDTSGAPRWAFRDLDALVGAMLPGDLGIVGALTGNGKSTLLMSQMDAFAVAKVPTLYVPLEVAPSRVRTLWAAWKLGLDVRRVVRGEWAALGEGAREAVDGVLEEQEADPYIHFASPRRLTVPALVQWCRWAKAETGARVIMLDHIHRLSFGGGGSGGGSNYRVDVTEGARALKDMAVELGVVLLAAAQLTRSGDQVDQLVPPQMARLKESGGIAEESDVVLMLSRCLRRDLPKGWEKDLRLGRITEREVTEPDVMGAICRKHRLDPDALNRSVRMGVANGRLHDLPLRDTWRHPGAAA